MKRRTEGHAQTTISGDTRADWSEAFELVPSLEVAYVITTTPEYEAVLQKAGAVLAAARAEYNSGPATA